MKERCPDYPTTRLLDAKRLLQKRGQRSAITTWPLLDTTTLLRETEYLPPEPRLPLISSASGPTRDHGRHRSRVR